MNMLDSFRAYHKEINLKYIATSALLTFAASFLGFLLVSVDASQLTPEGIMAFFSQPREIMAETAISILFGAFVAGIRALGQFAILGLTRTAQALSPITPVQIEKDPQGGPVE